MGILRETLTKKGRAPLQIMIEAMLDVYEKEGAVAAFWLAKECARHEEAYGWARELSNVRVLGLDLESGTFRAIDRPEVPSFWALWPATALAEGLSRSTPPVLLGAQDRHVLSALLQGKAKPDLRAIGMAPTRRRHSALLPRFGPPAQISQRLRTPLLAFYHFRAEHWAHYSLAGPPVVVIPSPLNG